MRFSCRRAWLAIFIALNGAVSLFCVSAFASTSASAVAEGKAAELPLGQLLIVGFKGTQLKDGLDEVIKETKPGAILLFGRNVKSAEQVAKLNFEAQNLSKKVAKSPLLIAIDQEGGNVIRIRHTPTLPSALAIAKTRDLTVARRAGLATGRLLRSLGININLAPVVDVSDPDTDHFLGTRSFGNNPRRVAAMTTALAMGLQENGVLPIAKHFPGHGDASGDSHLVAATNPSDRNQLFERDLVPYMSLAKYLKRPWGAMLAHVSFPNVDESGSPATFSKPIVTDILRKHVSASALVMTDDIEMAGAATEKDVGLRAVRAIEAGADMVMIAWSRKIQKDVMTALKEAVDSGRLKRSRVEEALKRIAAAKKSYVPDVIKLASRDELTRNLKNPEFTMLGNAVLRAAARNLEERRPASLTTEAAVVASATDSSTASDEMSPALLGSTPPRMKPGLDPVIVLSARVDFLEAFRKTATGFKVNSQYLRPSKKAEIERVLRANPESSIFVYVSGRQVAEYISSLDDDIASRMILVNVETRASLERPERFRDIFDVHYRHPDLGKVVAESYLDIVSEKPSEKSSSKQVASRSGKSVTDRTPSARSSNAPSARFDSAPSARFDSAPSARQTEVYQSEEQTP